MPHISAENARSLSVNGGEEVLLHLSITYCLSMLFYKTACLVPQDVPQIGPLGNPWPLRRPRTSGGRRRRTRLKTRWRRLLVHPKPLILTTKTGDPLRPPPPPPTPPPCQAGCSA